MPDVRVGLGQVLEPLRVLVDEGLDLILVGALSSPLNDLDKDASVISNR